jgi:hypothetical protein
MANYILLDSDPEVPPPYVFPGVTVRSFRLAADPIQLQVLCDNYLNIGSLSDRRLEYLAIAPFVDLEFVVYPEMRYGDPPYSGWGFTTQQELYFKFFVAKLVLVDDLFLLPAPEIICFFPYIFVDNAWSCFAGREVIGFPKLLAEFQVPAAGVPYPIEARTQTIDAFAPASELRPRRFVTIAAAAGAATPLVNSWTLPAAVVQQLPPVLQVPLALAQANNPGLLRTVHLKQFRDVGSPMNAAYQAIVEGRFTVSNLQAFNLPPAEITLIPQATLSIAINLGLIGPAPFQPVSQFGATCDLRYSNATTVFVNS